MHRHKQKHSYNSDVLMPASFIQEFLDVLARVFGTACANCLQVEVIVTIRPLIFWLRMCVWACGQDY